MADYKLSYTGDQTDEALGKAMKAVLTEAQNLTEAQQEQVRKNIGASVTADNIQAALGYVPVKDVQVGGTSVLANGVANVPIASEAKEGVIKAPFANGAFGIQLNQDNRPYVSAASETDISARQTFYRPIVPSRMDYAVKAAMCDGKGAAWTDEERLAALLRLGCTVDDSGVVHWTSQTGG